MLSPIKVENDDDDDVLARLGRNDLAQNIIKSPYYNACRKTSCNIRKKITSRPKRSPKDQTISPTSYSVDTSTTLASSKPSSSKKRVQFSENVRKPTTRKKSFPTTRNKMMEYVPDRTFIPAKLRIRRQASSYKQSYPESQSKPTFLTKKTCISKQQKQFQKSKRIHATAEQLLSPVTRNINDSAVSSEFGERLRALRVSVEAENEKMITSLPSSRSVRSVRSNNNNNNNNTMMMKSQYSRRSIQTVQTKSSVSSAAERLRKAQQRAFETKRLCVHFLKEAKAYIRPLLTDD